MGYEMQRRRVIDEGWDGERPIVLPGGVLMRFVRPLFDRFFGKMTSPEGKEVKKGETARKKKEKVIIRRNWG